MSVKFEVQMTDKYMYDFMLYHNYSRLSGIFGTVLGVVGLWIAINNIIAGQWQTAIFGFVITFLFFVYIPFSLKQTAKRQVKTVKAFEKPLEYELTGEGITVRQDETEALTTWDEFAKAVSSNKSIILYITRVRAVVFPKECMGEKSEEVVKMISTHMPAAKVKIKHI